ncbi:MAG: hypothetical protein R2939_20550 [Kofleriaceae bacterium]
MSGGPIDGIGGVGGASSAPELDAADAASAVDATAATEATTGAGALDALAAAVEAGAVSPQQALEQLLDERLAADLEPADRAELRAMILELAEADPYLAGLLGRLG